MNNLTLMLKSGYCPPPANMDKKTAQFFVCKAYLRYRANREEYNKNPADDASFFIRNESWNVLQVFKQYYYEFTRAKQLD